MKTIGRHFTSICVVWCKRHGANFVFSNTYKRNFQTQKNLKSELSLCSDKVISHGSWPGAISSFIVFAATKNSLKTFENYSKNTTADFPNSLPLPETALSAVGAIVAACKETGWLLLVSSSSSDPAIASVVLVNLLVNELEGCILTKDKIWRLWQLVSCGMRTVRQQILSKTLQTFMSNWTFWTCLGEILNDLFHRLKRLY